VNHAIKQRAGVWRLPFGLFEEIRLKFLAALKTRGSHVVPRSE
jgi:hypothetical protein